MATDGGAPQSSDKASMSCGIEEEEGAARDGNGAGNREAFPRMKPIN